MARKKADGIQRDRYPYKEVYPFRYGEIKVDKLKIDIDKSYQKRYRMRSIGGGIVTTVPMIIVHRKARELGITVEEFTKKYCVVMMFNDFGKADGAFIFEKIEEAEP